MKSYSSTKPKLSDLIVFTERQKLAHQHIGTGEIVFYGGARGGGKALEINELVATPFGFRGIGELKIGDTICNPNGSPQTIIGVYDQGVQDIYTVRFTDGATVNTTLDHLWLVRKTNTKSKQTKDAIFWDDEYEGTIWTTLMIKEFLDKKEISANECSIKEQNLLIPLCEPVRFTKSYRYDVKPIHPYLLGVLIGDGCLSNSQHSVSYSKPDVEIAEKISSLGYKVSTGNQELWAVNNQEGGLMAELKSMGLWGCLADTKFIPEYYKYATVEERIELMQGLMDTDGYVDDRGHMSYTTISEQLALDVQWIVRSLGGKATITGKIPTYTYDNEKKNGQYAYTVFFNTKINAQLVYLPRKKKRTKEGFNGDASILQRRVESITFSHKGECRCISVSNKNGLFITKDFIVTHNSYFALAEAIMQSKKHPGLVTVIVRETYTELIRNFVNKLHLFPAEVFGFKYMKSEKTAFFKNGSMIYFQSIETEDDLNKVQGVEYQFMVIDEAPKHYEDNIEKLRGSLRRNPGLTTFIPTILMTGNPGGKSDMYFKTHFIQPDYTRWHDNELPLQDMHVFIPALVSDNPHVGEEYVQFLKSLHPELRAKWLEGKWDIYEGAFFQEWNEDVHTCGSFEIPEDWYKVSAIDEGWSKKHPAVCLWLAQDPKDMTIYVYREYVQRGNTEQYARDVANLNLGENIRMFADPSFFYTIKKDEAYTQTSAMIFASNGVPLEKANNNRVDGWRVVKQWLHWTSRKQPKLKIFETCRQLINTLPTLTYDKSQKDDLDTHQQDDAADALRYALVSGFGYPGAAEVEFMEEEAAWEEESKTMEEILADNVYRIGYDAPTLRPRPEQFSDRYRQRIYKSAASMFI